MKFVQIFRTNDGKESFSDWMQCRDKISKAKINAYIERVALGDSRKNVKAIGDGVFEIKIDYGPGFRVYFGEFGNSTILLLLAGDKSTQSRDIKMAKEYWRQANAQT